MKITIATIAKNNLPVSSADEAPQKMQHILAPILLLIMLCNGDSSVSDAGVTAAFMEQKLRFTAVMRFSHVTSRPRWFVRKMNESQRCLVTESDDLRKAGLFLALSGL